MSTFAILILVLDNSIFSNENCFVKINITKIKIVVKENNNNNFLFMYKKKIQINSSVLIDHEYAQFQ